jgi:oxygen-independent coproporphyrinogen-3 oxidase
MESNSIIENIGLYVHIPFCRSKCRYCGFYSRPVENYDVERLIASVITELDNYSRVDSVQTVYIGGGSPSCLPAKELLKLIGYIQNRWKAIEEFTMECNPGQVNFEMLREIRNLGVNRISIGAQSFNQSELEFLGRTHNADDIFKAVTPAKKAGFENISIDLIFAIPGSTISSWRQNLLQATRLGVSHISTYSLSYEDGTILKQQLDTGAIQAVDEETDRAMYELAIKMFESGGFEHYEISNFAKPGFRCRHNMRYWQNRPYIGVGPAAASCIGNRRTKNIADIDKYIQAIETNNSAAEEAVILSAGDIASETAVLNLRTADGIDIEDYKQRHGLDVCDVFAEPINRYRKLDFIAREQNSVHLTKKALPIADTILCDFIID